MAAAERLKAKARGRAGPVASPPPPPSVRVQTGAGGCRNNPPFPGVHASPHPAFPLDSGAGALWLMDGGEKGGFVVK